MLNSPVNSRTITRLLRETLDNQAPANALAQLDSGGVYCALLMSSNKISKTQYATQVVATVYAMPEISTESNVGACVASIWATFLNSASRSADPSISTAASDMPPNTIIGSLGAGDVVVNPPMTVVQQQFASAGIQFGFPDPTHMDFAYTVPSPTLPQEMSVQQATTAASDIVHGKIQGNASLQELLIDTDQCRIYALALSKPTFVSQTTQAEDETIWTVCLVTRPHHQFNNDLRNNGWLIGEIKRRAKSLASQLHTLLYSPTDAFAQIQLTQ